MVQLQITIDGSKFQFNIMAREDATPEEYEVAKQMQDLHVSIMQSAGVPVKVTEVEDKRHLTKRALDGGDVAPVDSVVNQSSSAGQGESSPAAQ